MVAEAFNEVALRLNALHDLSQLLASASQLDQVLDGILGAMGHILGPGVAAVEGFGGQNGLAAPGPGVSDLVERAMDPGLPGQGGPPGVLERHADRDGDTHSLGGPDRDPDAPGPPALHEPDGPDAGDIDGPGAGKGVIPALLAGRLNPRSKISAACLFR